MKWFISTLTILMVAGLGVATYVYAKQEKMTQPVSIPFTQASPDEEEADQSDDLYPVHDETIDYTLQNEELQMTYNHGDDWVKVPIEVDVLFAGEYQGNQQELIGGSYVLTEDRAAFLYMEAIGESKNQLMLTYSLDQGDTWEESIVSESFPGIRFRKVDFLNDQFGYVIASGGRTMSQEYSTAFLTKDGGKSWEATNEPDTTRLIADGGFINETTGFLSYGTINPEAPDFYVTEDGGDTWNSAVFHMPDKYDKVFVSPETPKVEGDRLTVLVGQGPNGDYEGGEVKGKFTSEDNGKTWEFLEEETADENAQE